MRGKTMTSKTSPAFNLFIPLQLIGVGLILLKASGLTAWPWWAVTLPFWSPFALAAVFFLIGLACVVGGEIVKSYKKDKDADPTV